MDHGEYQIGSTPASRAAAAMGRRRRRFLMRRRRAAANGGGRPVGPGERVLENGSSSGYPSAVTGYPMAAGGGGGADDIPIGGVPEEEEAAEVEVEILRGNPVPVVGAISMAGRQPYMEDAICIKTRLCSPAINGYMPFSILCKQKMHEILKEELTGQPMRLWRQRYPSPAPPPGMITDESLLQETWRKLMGRCFERTETAAFRTCSCGSVGFRCQCNATPQNYCGTAAVAVVLTEDHVVTANCGDSRAVLFRGPGIVVPLSFDHKANRRDEIARIEAAGGRVLLTDTFRVEGMLAMTRSIGDEFLKPMLISEPEVTFNRRCVEDDEFIVLATDCLWDVISPQMVGDVTRECLKEPRDVIIDNRGRPRAGDDEEAAAAAEPITVSPSRCASAAALLCRLALARNSIDNISVVVVDLKRPGSDQPRSEHLINNM